MPTTTYLRDLDAPDLHGTGFDSDSRAPQAFHVTLPGFERTDLLEVPALASALGVRAVMVKNEALRASLPSFKILGASWASGRAIWREWLGADPTVPIEFGPLREAVSRLTVEQPDREFMLVAATDGNHGRGVAYFARQMGLAAWILVPEGTAQARIDAIAGEGARVDVVDGTYDDAIAASAQLAGPDRLVISDTSWDGYVTTPRDVIDGYSTLFYEVDDQVAERALPSPTHVVLQAGVGSFAAAGLRHFVGRGVDSIIVEPSTANCLMASARAGDMTEVPGPHRSAMAGLNCGLPSLIAWPVVDGLADRFIAIDDDTLAGATVALADAGIESGESGVAGAAALLDLASTGRLDEAGLGSDSVVLFINTEGITDPVNYERLLTAGADG
ncbi:diaminopropionate ammonia-lyase [Amnibacterium flavum]|uniref:Diaminopropionate ammonia-lyase n=1 Tax=Amnibacterium flavum TaxID=2173173 RepID=A0A2V1HU69_9MICO|nr:diaminopropionate ammonia-lyase [Amnibacterium flavum]PVZ94510.1 diaminopropionate ammonia-lyase [Amnibacterium flavum]